MKAFVFGSQFHFLPLDKLIFGIKITIKLTTKESHIYFEEARL